MARPQKKELTSILSDHKRVKTYGVSLVLSLAALGLLQFGLAQDKPPQTKSAPADWQTSTKLPGVDLTGLSETARKVVLGALRSEQCSCGCDMKIAECRFKDPGCGVSRRMAALAIKEAEAGKLSADIRVDLKKFSADPPLLDDPVKLSIGEAPIKGPTNAKVTIIEFSDFQCPYCAQAAVEAAQVLKQYPADVRLVFKQFPLETHSQASLAAEASLAAQAQGKFWQLHDKMYADYRNISHARILAWAQEIGLDMNRFRSELDSHKYARRVEAETKEGDNAGVEGTPTFFINGKKLNANFELATVGPLIGQELGH